MPAVVIGVEGGGGGSDRWPGRQGPLAVRGAGAARVRQCSERAHTRTDGRHRTGGLGGAPGGEERDEGRVARGAGVLVRRAALADGADGGVDDEWRGGPVGEALAEVDAFGLCGQRAELGPDGGPGAPGEALANDALSGRRQRLRARRRGDWRSECGGLVGRGVP